MSPVEVHAELDVLGIGVAQNVAPLASVVHHLRGVVVNSERQAVLH